MRGEKTYVKPVNILENRLATGVLGEGLFASLPCHRPVDQEQINIVQTESVERALQRLGDIVRVVCIVPELCCYEQLIARDTAGSNGLADGFFGSVSISISDRVQAKTGVYSRLSSVNMAVSCLDCFCDSVFLGLCVLPGTKSNGWDLSAGVELELRRHCRNCKASVD